MACSFFFGFLLRNRWSWESSTMTSLSVWDSSRATLGHSALLDSLSLYLNASWQPSSANFCFSSVNFFFFLQSASTAAKFEGFGISDPELIPSRDTTVRWMMTRVTLPLSIMLSSGQEHGAGDSPNPSGLFLIPLCQSCQAASTTSLLFYFVFVRSYSLTSCLWHFNLELSPIPSWLWKPF